MLNINAAPPAQSLGGNRLVEIILSLLLSPNFSICSPVFTSYIGLVHMYMAHHPHPSFSSGLLRKKSVFADPLRKSDDPLVQLLSEAMVTSPSP